MSTKNKWILILILALVLIAGVCTFCWFHVDGSELPLPEASAIKGYVTVTQIGLDASSATATHDSASFDMTDEQVSRFIQLLETSSYWRTRHGSSVSFDGDVVYTVSLAYQAGGKNEITMISILDNELINVLVNSDTTSGYLKITDPDYLAKLQSILDS